jgi:AmmeMemoRadiSam system protein B
MLPRPVLDLIALFDGEHAIDEMRGILLARHGAAPTAQQIADLAARLDEAGFLDSERLALRRRVLEDAWRRSPTRPAAHAGGAYAGEAGALAAQIDGFFREPEGPGPAPPENGGAAGLAPLRGLLAPHIDFHRGGPTYAWAYRELLERSDADLFVILGTCHAGMAHPFAVTLKPFATPLGEAPVDRDLYEAVARRAGQDLLADEPAHRHEHSVEFQAVMLRHLLGGRRDFTILPVLASYLHEAIWRRTGPEDDARVPRFIEALRSAVEASGRRVCLVAGVDLAHVGPRFGDASANTPAFLRDVEAADRAMLKAVTGGDHESFFAAVAADGDRRRICGLSPIYTCLRALGGVRGRLIRYTQWPDPEGAVTFCAAAFP